MGIRTFRLAKVHFRRVLFEAKTESASAVIDGSTVQFTSQMPPPSAYIQVSATNVTVVPELPVAPLAIAGGLISIIVIFGRATVTYRKVM